MSIGFHKAVGDHGASSDKRTRNGSMKIEDETNLNKYGDRRKFDYSMEYLFRKSNEISLPISCKLVSQTVLQTSLENVLSLRLREGYTVRRVQIGKGFSLINFVLLLFIFSLRLDEIEVHLVLPWRYDIQIYYTARSVWPLKDSVRTDIRVYKEAPMYVLQEVNQASYNQTLKAVNMTRNNLVRRYNDVIQT